MWKVKLVWGGGEEEAAHVDGEKVGAMAASNRHSLE